MLISIQTYDASFYSFIHIFTCLFIESIVIYWCDSTLNPNGGSEISSDYFQNRQIYTLEDSSPVNLQWIQTKYIQFSSVQFSRSVVSDSATPWTSARQASLSITYPRSSPKPMCIESVMPFNHLILCHPLLLLPSIFPRIRVFQMSQLFASGGKSTGVSASISVLPMNTQDWSPLGWTGWTSLQSKGLSRVFSNTTGQKHQFIGIQLSL